MSAEVQCYKCIVMQLENGTQVKLEISNCEKDLGVYVDNELKFSRHAELIANRANRLMGMMKISFTCIDKERFLCLFKRLVRPHLEYSNVVWSPRYKKDVEIIENVQRRASGVVADLENRNYEERLAEFQLTSLI